MQLEDYFEFEKFESPYGPYERIRLKGHRIAIEHVLEFYKQAVSAEEIVNTHFPSLTLEQVYATITYYLHNHDMVDEYLRRGEEVAEGFYQEHLRTRKPGGVGEKLRAMREAHELKKRESA